MRSLGGSLGAMSTEQAVDYITNQVPLTNRNKVKVDVVQVLNSEEGRNLKLAQGTYMDTNGTEIKCLSLNGLVPVKYLGASYQFPVDIYIFHNYPVNPPILYVRPTHNMVIVSGYFVDNNGLVMNLDYLKGWNSIKSLKGFLVEALARFGEKPPLMSIPSNKAPVTVFGAPINRDENNLYRSGTPAAVYSGVGGTSTNEKQELIKNITYKMKERLTQEYRILTEDCNQELYQQSNLNKSQENAKAEYDRLLRKIDEFKEAIELMKSKKIQLDEWELAAADSAKEEIDVETLLKPYDPASEQLIELDAEVCAIEDTIEFLKKAYTEKRISYTDLLKEVKSLTKDQFTKMSLIFKINNKIATEP